MNLVENQTRGGICIKIRFSEMKKEKGRNITYNESVKVGKAVYSLENIRNLINFERVV